MVVDAGFQQILSGTQTADRSRPAGRINEYLCGGLVQGRPRKTQKGGQDTARDYHGKQEPFFPLKVNEELMERRLRVHLLS